MKETGQLFENHRHLEDLKPQEVFDKMLEQHSYDDRTKALVTQAFQEIVEQIHTADHL